MCISENAAVPLNFICALLLKEVMGHFICTKRNTDRNCLLGYAVMMAISAVMNRIPTTWQSFTPLP
jgi:hypothetical protein